MSKIKFIIIQDKSLWIRICLLCKLFFCVGIFCDMTKDILRLSFLNIISFHFLSWTHFAFYFTAFDYFGVRFSFEEEAKETERKGTEKRSEKDIILNSNRIYDSILKKMSIWNDLGHQSFESQQRIECEISWDLVWSTRQRVFSGNKQAALLWEF